MKSGRKDPTAWYEAWFGSEYLDVYAHRDDREAGADIDQIERLIPLRQNQPILDLACGSGRHTLELARRGYAVTGLDLSDILLEVGRRNAAVENLDIPFVRGDMRHPPFSSIFGVVLNLFTSFGYFERDEENAAIFGAIHNALKPGGRFLVDYINRDYVLDRLVPEDISESPERIVIQRRKYDAGRERLEKTIVIAAAGTERTFVESVRLYNAGEMIAMAEENGLTVTATHGALDGRLAMEDAPRLVLVGSRPA